MNLLEINNLKVTFPLRRGKLQALRGLTYTMAEGEILGIVGESGSGKSVSVQALMRLLPSYARIEGASPAMPTSSSRLSVPAKPRVRRAPSPGPARRWRKLRAIRGFPKPAVSIKVAAFRRIPNEDRRRCAPKSSPWPRKSVRRWPC